MTILNSETHSNFLGVETATNNACNLLGMTCKTENILQTQHKETAKEDEE